MCHKYNKCDMSTKYTCWSPSNPAMKCIDSPNAETSENQCKSRLSSLCSANTGSEKTTWVGIISNFEQYKLHKYSK